MTLCDQAPGIHRLATGRAPRRLQSTEARRSGTFIVGGRQATAQNRAEVRELHNKGLAYFVIAKTPKGATRTITAR